MISMNASIRVEIWLSEKLRSSTISASIIRRRNPSFLFHDPLNVVAGRRNRVCSCGWNADKSIDIILVDHSIDHFRHFIDADIQINARVGLRHRIEKLIFVNILHRCRTRPTCRCPPPGRRRARQIFATAISSGTRWEDCPRGGGTFHSEWRQCPPDPFFHLVQQVPGSNQQSAVFPAA